MPERAQEKQAGGAEVVCHGVRRTNGALEELDEDSVAVSIPLQDVRALHLRFGMAGERPVPAIMLGVVLASLGGGACIQVATWFIDGGKIFRFQGLAVGLVPLGIGLICSALRRRYFLLVDTGAGGTRKLAFRRTATRKEVQRFASLLDARDELDTVR
jgi:hypothetical protein